MRLVLARWRWNRNRFDPDVREILRCREATLEGSQDVVPGYLPESLRDDEAGFAVRRWTAILRHFHFHLVPFDF